MQGPNCLDESRFGLESSSYGQCCYICLHLKEDHPPWYRRHLIWSKNSRQRRYLSFSLNDIEPVGRFGTGFVLVIVFGFAVVIFDSVKIVVFVVESFVVEWEELLVMADWLT